MPSNDGGSVLSFFSLLLDSNGNTYLKAHARTCSQLTVFPLSPVAAQPFPLSPVALPT